LDYPPFSLVVQIIHDDQEKVENFFMSAL
jgi:hypothetical protein